MATVTGNKVKMQMQPAAPPILKGNVMTDTIKELIEAGDRYWIDEWTPDQFAAISYNARPAIKAMQEENERLKARLEISPDHNFDGIEARDCTIKGLESRIDRLKALLAECEGVIEQHERHENVNWHMAGDKEKSKAEKGLRRIRRKTLAKLKGGE